ncbi:phosphate-starvation-inducible protein PsiE [Roseospirillum parvum]|uniref:Protein PsiE n=1 Tax=Roseospirillum parvum TaxID=83401 RepID=A0A1G8AK38_9PROT|nr:phosphate-starvation-inducible PsiE family protein [Roseospirillum parvum]SDH21288.1 Phosphate starvation-inducible membrane PsiE [Roseospirillum parvum]
MTPTNLMRFSERVLLGLVMLMTLAAVGLEVRDVVISRTVTLADILLLFLYAEVLSMVTVYYAQDRAAFLYPIVIAMTALSRLIVLQGKEMDPRSILFEASAIFILALALVLMRSPVLRGLVDRSFGERPLGDGSADGAPATPARQDTPDNEPPTEVSSRR